MSTKSLNLEFLLHLAYDVSYRTPVNTNQIMKIIKDNDRSFNEVMKTALPNIFPLVLFGFIWRSKVYKLIDHQLQEEIG